MVLSLVAKFTDTNTGRLAIIDGDPLVYRVGFASQKNIYSKDGEVFEGIRAVKAAYPDANIEEWEFHLEVDTLKNIYHAINLSIYSMLYETDSDSYVMYIGGKGNFRNELAVSHPYKGTRDKGHRPVYYDEIRQWLIKRHNAIEVNGMEADDAVAIKAIQVKNSVICTIDKDLDTVEGLHYNYGNGKLYTVDKLGALKKFYKQMLTGDSSDNIVGIRGVGNKKADKIIDSCEDEQSMIVAVASEYLHEFGDIAEQRFIENASLLYMLRHSEDRYMPPSNLSDLFIELSEGKDDKQV